MSPLDPPSCLLAASNLRLADPLWLVAVAVLPLAVWLRGRSRVPVLLVPFAAASSRGLSRLKSALRATPASG